MRRALRLSRADDTWLRERLPGVVRRGAKVDLAPTLEAAATAGEDVEVRSLEWREIDRPRRGTTFDGRDWFAPTGARLAGGLSLAEVGPERDGWVTLDSFAPQSVPGGFEAEIIRTDRYGNLVSTVEESFLRREFGEDWREVEVHLAPHSARACGNRCFGRRGHARDARSGCARWC